MGNGEESEQKMLKIAFSLILLTLVFGLIRAIEDTPFGERIYKSGLKLLEPKKKERD